MRKKIITIAAALCAMCLLGACGIIENLLPPRTLVLTVDTIRGEDSVEFEKSILQDGVGEGELRFSDWAYEGTFSGEALLSGRADRYPCVLVLAGEEHAGRYTGPLENGSPDGDGIFTADDGAVYAGQVRGLAALRGDVSGLACAVTRDGSRYTGAYEGPVENGAFSGEGYFSGRNAVGQALSWDGGFAAGEFSGEGTLICDRWICSVEGETVMGRYEGAGSDGVPEGEGELRSVDGKGVSFRYSGNWHKGRPEGVGELVYDAQNRYVRRGYFTQGSYTPDFMQALETYGSCEPKFTIGDTLRAFLEQYPQIWEAETHENFLDSEYKQLFDKKLTVKACFDDPAELDDPRWMCQYSLRLVTADAGPLFPGGPVMTVITATESTYTKVVRVMVPGELTGLYRGQRFHAYAVPLAMSTYTTVLGEQRDCLLLLAGDVYIGP